MKAGYKTTEFWLSAAATVAGLLLTAGVFEEQSGWAKALGVVAGALAAAGYSYSRATTKAAEGK